MARFAAALAALSVGLAAGVPAGAGVTVIGASNAHRCMEAAMAGSKARAAMDICDAALGEEALDRPNKAGTLVNRGVIHMNRRDYASALADFEAALALRPDLPEAFMNRGSVRIAQGRYQDGLTDTNAALEMGVNQPERAYYNRALAREELRDTRGAYLDYRQASQLKPGWELPRMELARFSVQRR